MIVHRSQQAGRLAAALAEHLRTPGPDPFSPEKVVVGGRAAERWLSSRIAQELGVAANLRFLSPSTLVEELLAQAHGVDREQVDAWRPERLMWAVLRCLPPLLQNDRFAPVRFYLGEDAAPGSARLVGLARRVGDCFARYATTRPDVVLRWDAGEESDRNDWQPELWRAIRSSIAVPHLPELANRLPEVLARDSAARATLPRRILWYAHASVARLHLDVLEVLSRHGVEVHAFLLSPSRGAVEHVRASAASSAMNPAELELPLGNILLESLWRPSRDVELLLHLSNGRDAVADVDLFVDPSSGTALGALQRELLECRTPDPGAERKEIAVTDRSLCIHACHGPMRQVEVLRDELLRLFDEDPSLQPRDVLVLTPSLAAYAPLVDAVFAPRGRDGKQAAASAPSIPVRIAGQPLRQVNAVADVLLRALALATSRVDAVSVLDLLATPAVSARFRFTADDHETLRTWVSESGIRCSVDAAHREGLGLPGVAQHSWRFGLDRLLLGHAMPGGERELFAGVLPYDDVEGGIAELLGRFAEACERLFGIARGMQQPRALGAWRSALLEAVDALVDAEDDAFMLGARQLRAALDDLVEDARELQSDVPLELGAVRHLLDARFDDPAEMRGGGPGAVTLCALQPGRTTGARVVALLGMDEGEFPRRRGGAGFDMLLREPRVGDADPCADDRLRMLEAIMSAEDTLLITYTGRSLDTNERLAPAVPVGELLDAIDSLFAGGEDADGRHHAARRRIVVDHPLQPFSPHNFEPAGDDAAPLSYESLFLDGALRLRAPRVPPAEFITAAFPLPPLRGGAERVLRLDDLARFLGAPAERLLAERFKLRLGGAEADVEAREPVALDGLSRWALADLLLRRSLDHTDAQMWGMYDAVAASGRLPHGAPGRLAFEGASRDAHEIRGKVIRLLGEEERPAVDVDIVLGGVRLMGRLDGIVGDGLLRWQAGELHGKHLLDLWVRHLVLHLACPELPPRSVLIAKPNTKGNVWTVRRVSDAEERLAALVALYEQGLTRPLPLFSKSSRAYAEAFLKEMDEPTGRAKGASAARRSWEPSFDGPPGESENAYIARVFGAVKPYAHDSGPIGAEFHELALGVWQPVLDHLDRSH